MEAAHLFCKTERNRAEMPQNKQPRSHYEQHLGPGDGKVLMGLQTNYVELDRKI